MLGLAEDAFETQEELLAHFTALTEQQSALEAITKELGIDEESSPVDTIKSLKENQIPEGAKLMSDKETSLLAALDESFGDTLDTVDWASLKEQAANGEEYLTSLRDQASTMYKLVSGETDVDATIVAAIEKASLKEAKAYKKMYTSLADKTVPLTCQSCGSSDVSRASHKKDPKDPEKTDSYSDTKKQVVDSHKRKASDIHGE